MAPDAIASNTPLKERWIEDKINGERSTPIIDAAMNPHVIPLLGEGACLPSAVNAAQQTPEINMRSAELISGRVADGNINQTNPTIERPIPMISRN